MSGQIQLFQHDRTFFRTVLPAGQAQCKQIRLGNRLTRRLFPALLTADPRPLQNLKQLVGINAFATRLPLFPRLFECCRTDTGG